MSPEVGQWEQGGVAVLLLRLAYSPDRGGVHHHAIPPGTTHVGHPVTGPWQFSKPV